jgi:O-antigen/teichoic acid export membrane protein
MVVAGFAGVVVEWGQATLLTREVARRSPEEAQLLSSSILFRIVGTLLAAAITCGIIFALGYNSNTNLLAPLAVLSSLPLALAQTLGYVFRGRDRMDLDVAATTIGKVVTVAATLFALALGGGVMAVLAMQTLGGAASLAAALLLAVPVGIRLTKPATSTIQKLLISGAPIVIYVIALTLQPLIDVWILSLLTNHGVVGWYGAARTILGMILAPAAILGAAAFPELSRVAGSASDFRRVLEVTARPLLAVSALAAAGVYAFAGDIIAVIYGRGSFDNSALILMISAPALPLTFLGFLLGTANNALGKTKEIAVAKVLIIGAGAIMSYLLINICQSHFGNGALGLAITTSTTEVVMVIALVALLPKAKAPRTLLLDFIRAALTAIFTVLIAKVLRTPLLWINIPFFLLTFLAVSLATRLVLRADLDNILRYAPVPAALRKQPK